MGLERYHEKRDFSRTSEPRGKMHRTAGFSYVVQKHAARRLHYDFRLELDGVLLSWAIPKGPSLDPSVKRLAVQTEDHPVEYGDFEGIIPAGEYGGGTVIVWDRGRWVPEGDPRKDYARGRLTFGLQGEKLSGSWHLVRTRGNGKDRSWLLMKSVDASAVRGPRADVVDERPESALSGRTLEQVKADPNRVWHSNANGAPGKAARAKRAADGAPSARGLAGAKRAAQPSFIEPQLATLAPAAPSGDEWLHEIKLDGYRMQFHCDGASVTARTRNGHDWSERMPSLVRELAGLGLPRAIFDAELVVLREGVSDFQRLQNSLRAGRDMECLLYVFDLLFLGEYDLREVALIERKRLLAATLSAAGVQPHARVRLSEHVVGRGPEFFAGACELGVEGSLCKSSGSHYRSGRTRDWLKVKCLSRQECVIGGFTKPAGSRSHFGALLLGLHEAGELRYVGRVGTGFSASSLAELHERLQPLVRSRSPFANPPKGADAKDVQWVAPELVAEVTYAERTADGLVRHAAFRGLRDDKPAREVGEEVTASSAPARAKAGVKRKQAEPALALREVRLTHPKRVLFPALGITKTDVALYYARVAERMLPHVARRPLMLVRCPDGLAGECFHQKHPGKGGSSSIKRVPIAESRGKHETAYVEDAEGLVQLIQVSALEIHAWGCRVDDVEHPDQLTFDLDPDEGLPWGRVIEAARLVRERLTQLELPAYLKTTGGKGLHIVVPIAPSATWDEAKTFCKEFCERIVRAEPGKYVATVSKAKRKGKILLDYFRNGRGATAVCPYSTRARPNASVSMPIAWDELTEALRPDQFTLPNAPQRLTEPDPWADFGNVRRRIKIRPGKVAVPPAR